MTPVDPQTLRDAELVASMSRRDHRAAAVLYDRYSAMVYALALRITGEPANAEEVVLDAFTEAWKESERYDEQQSTVTGWLTTIVRTRALDHARARGRRTRVTDIAARATANQPRTRDVDGPVGDNERTSAVNTAMVSLPDPQREVIELAYFEGLTHSEISARLDEPLGTIMTHVRLGMQKLREDLRSFSRERSS